METVQFKSESETAEPQAVTDEELFCDYLSARLEQALDALNAARDELSARPQDFNRASDVMRKVYELRDLKKQLALQRERVKAARASAGMEPLPETPATTPTPEFRAVQAEQAEKIMAALSAQPRTCPSCQAPILGEAGQCLCGHALASPLSDPHDDNTDAPHEPVA